MPVQQQLRGQALTDSSHSAISFALLCSETFCRANTQAAITKGLLQIARGALRS